METKRPYFIFFTSTFILFFSACTEINQSVSSVELSKDSTRRAPKAKAADKSMLSAIMGFFDTAQGQQNSEDSDTYAIGYLDSAANNLFTIPIDTFSVNPYGFQKDELISYPDSVYQQRFNNITSDLELTYNSHVENFIDLYAIRKKDLTERMMGKSMLYFPYIEQVLMEEKLPQELKYLTMVESALHATASSHMEAVGLWQIRYNTGRWLGMQINDYLDERRDPYVSTQTAVKYLKKLYSMYGNWPMALAAYNSGPGNVNKAIIRAGRSKNYWKIRKYLPSETRSYVPAFMALVYLNRYSKEHNLRPQLPELPFQAVDTVRLYHEVDFEELSDVLALEQEHLEFLNPALTKKIVPASRDGWPLVLPLNKIAAFESEYQSLIAGYVSDDEIATTAQVLKQRKEIVPNAPDLKLIEHKVKRGQTMIGIAARYGVSIRQIRDWNAMHDNVIRSGQSLKIYVPESQYARSRY
ncbi:transglycosylase SLT domain-containing protein [Porifericola rhodea]|uniref:lytic transglycosylase domain-containing protein n=1 Tax=Porifericola rhodea TaxID=930972 RepID=UPI00266519B0|nr:lytic transglycosylase domain-containing protein [Porifericola rhodea]WKN29861.1 transglycosylase SLT domain-containing protein [Porifericola rhodea]